MESEREREREGGGRREIEIGATEIQRKEWEKGERDKEVRVMREGREMGEGMRRHGEGGEGRRVSERYI